MKPDKAAIHAECRPMASASSRFFMPGDFLQHPCPGNGSAATSILPVKMDLAILYEDEDLLVVNKAGRYACPPFHQAITTTPWPTQLPGIISEKGKTFVYRCINRLDRDTTGALILAKNPYSAAVLSAQMKQRQIRRTYLAIVSGITPSRTGTIDAPIGRSRRLLLSMRTVDPLNGERAVTHYQRLAAYAPTRWNILSSSDAQQTDYLQAYALIELHLETGRTHQIRVHMMHIGHPLPGDFLYNPDYRIIKRQPLHSYQLTFSHPVTGKSMEITAPVPEDFRVVQ